MFILAFGLVEGLSSLVLFTRDLASAEPGLHSRVHAQPDTLTGWINIPDLDIPDLYGPGVGFRTNGQSFRNDHDFTAAVPPERTRLLCVGDSFTLGIGVANDETWCALLEAANPRLQTVNLGHAGYGIDQAYLLYRRDGDRLEHDLVVFAFIPDDLRRMALRRFLGHDKPVMRLREGELVTENVPVPQPSRLVMYFRKRARYFDQLRSLELGRRVLRRVAGVSEDTSSEPSQEEIWQTAVRVFAELAELNRRRGGEAVFVLIGQKAELPEYLGLRSFLRREMAARGLVFLDLIGPLRALPYGEATDLFHPHWTHFTVEGNRFVADRVHRLLVDQEFIPPSDSTLAGDTELLADPDHATPSPEPPPPANAPAQAASSVRPTAGGAR